MATDGAEPLSPGETEAEASLMAVASYFDDSVIDALAFNVEDGYSTEHSMSDGCYGLANDACQLEASEIFDVSDDAIPSPAGGGESSVQTEDPSSWNCWRIPTDPQLEERMEEFWEETLKEVSGAAGPWTSSDLPLARIKRIMKLDSCFNPQMVGADGAQMAAYLSEVFVKCVTTRAWWFTARDARRTLQLKDLQMAIRSCPDFDLLIDILL
eukprot:6202010-Pleurochrysis_carterae.AAC.1